MAAKTPEIAILLKSTYPFKTFTNDFLDWFIAALNVVELAPTQEVFKIGEDANQLFIVLSGHVTLNRLNQINEFDTFAVADPGEFFGLEAVQPRNHYRVTASAKTNAKVLYIQTTDLLEVLKESSELGRLLNALHKSYHALVEMRLSWKEQEEYVFLSIRKHWFFLWSKLLIPIIPFSALVIFLLFASLSFAENFGLVLIILLVAFIIAGLAALYIYVDWKDDFYMVSDRKVLSRQRDILLYETKNIVPFSAVLSVTKKVPGFWAALMLYGDVDLRTYTGVLKLKGIADPEIITGLIDNIRNRLTYIQRKGTREENILEMRKRLGLAQEGSPIAASQSTPDASQIDLAEDNSLHFINSLFQALLQLRVVKGDEITYRKHWILLIRNSRILYLVQTAITLFLLYGLITLISLSMPIPPLFLTIPAGIAWLIIAGVLTYKFIDWRNDRFVLTNRAIMDLDKKPLGKENRRTAPLANIQSVEYKREGLSRIIFNYGTVFIRVGDTQFTFDEVANPFKVQQEITERLNQAKDRERRNEIKRERETILDWIEIYHTVAHKETGPKKENPDQEEDDIIKF